MNSYKIFAVKPVSSVTTCVNRIGMVETRDWCGLPHQPAIGPVSAGSRSASVAQSQVASHSWSAVKLDLYGLKFFTLHVLRKPWAMPHLIKPPKAARLPDIVTVAEAQALFAATRTLSYRVFFFVLYSLGLRLSEGLALKVGDIDGQRARVHIRDSKGNRDRFVPLPDATLDVLRKFWHVHRHPELLFPNRAGGLAGAHSATSPLDRGGVQKTLHQVTLQCGLKKRSPHTVCATAMQRI